MPFVTVWPSGRPDLSQRYCFDLQGTTSTLGEYKAWAEYDQVPCQVSVTRSFDRILVSGEVKVNIGT